MPLLLLAALAGCNLPCDVSGPLAYDVDGSWICRPGDPDDACRESFATVSIAPDGTRTRTEVSAVGDEADVACFVVYPTLDLRIRSGMDLDLSDLDRPRDWARRFATRLGEVCRVWVPAYRQVTIGTYLGPGTLHQDTCLDNAYADVEAAFDAFLDAEPDARIVLFGHSQGGQHLTRLLEERFDDPALAGRLLAAYPLGWAVPAELEGPIVAYRSLLEGEDPPKPGRFTRDRSIACDHPADPSTPGPALLRALTAAHDDEVVDVPADLGPGDHAVWPEGFEGTCRDGDDGAYLEVRWVRGDPPPVDLDAPALTELNGAHLIDVHLGLEDLLEDLRAAGAGRPQRSAPPQLDPAPAVQP